MKASFLVFAITVHAFYMYMRVKGLNDSDDQRFVSQTCFHGQCYCASLCVQLVTSTDIGAGLQKYFTGSTLITYFTTKSILRFKSYSNHTINKIIHLTEKFFACPSPFKLSGGYGMI